MGDVAIRMFKYASITGIVTDEAGEPIVGAQVRADRRVWLSRPARPVAQASSATTDDRGMYRLFNLVARRVCRRIVPMTSGSSPTAIVNTPEARQNLSGSSQMLKHVHGRRRGRHPGDAQTAGSCCRCSASRARRLPTARAAGARTRRPYYPGDADRVDSRTDHARVGRRSHAASIW